MSGDFDDAYTGILTRLSRIPLRAYDPPVALWGGEVPPWGPRERELSLGGAGWDDDAAREACIGEAIERLQAYPLPEDELVVASPSSWPIDEPAIEPGRWVLFHPDQHGRPDFPFVPFTRDLRCRWVCFREAGSGEPRWVPEEIGYLFHSPQAAARISPSYSTGLSCGRRDHPVLLRGLQETIERDGVVGAWWGRYPLEEWPEKDVAPALPPQAIARNRRFRFFRVRSPFSDHVTLVTVEGQDREGFVFAAGSACRGTLAASWAKSALEAIQGAVYVRQLRLDRGGLEWADDLADYAHHAAYYSAHPERIEETVLHRAIAPATVTPVEETIGVLRERLGAERPVLFRIMTPTAVAEEYRDWLVVRVVVPGLQPLHGNHRWPHLGGPAWSRPVSDWPAQPPHPFA